MSKLTNKLGKLLDSMYEKQRAALKHGGWGAVEVRNEVGSTLRKPTKAEVAERKELREKILKAREDFRKAAENLAKLEKSCDHLIIFDLDGFDYYPRHCAACDKLIGLI
jgi:hypothetical protein